MFNKIGEDHVHGNYLRIKEKRYNQGTMKQFEHEQRGHYEIYKLTHDSD